MNVDDFYELLKSRVSGQVINGTLTGVLLESELKEVYEQIRGKQRDIEAIEQGSGG